MNGIAAFGRVLFALAIVGFGIQHLLLKGMVVGVELVPPWSPSHLVWTILFTAILLLCGLCIALNRFAVIASLLVAVLFLNAVIVLDLPRAMAKFMDLTERTRFFESLSFAAGALIIAGLVAKGNRTSGLWRATQILALIGTWLLAISMVIFGISHFLIPGFIAFLIPKWIPWHLFLAWFTGVAFVLAGISFAIRLLARSAALLLGLMFLSWVVVLHGPRIAGALHNGDEWNSGLVALGIAGLTFALCGSTAARRHLSWM
jgi:uncharacterized membrane protein YphA (DoxX/SURF4 family)